MMSQLKTVLLLGGLTGLLLFIGSFFGTGGLTVAIIFVGIMNLGSYFFSDKLVLAMYRAKEIKKGDMRWLHEMVRDVSERARIPEPKIYIIEASHSNAFATGRNPKHASVAFTRGIIELLDKDELKGVLAHEIAHVKNRDILISSVAATIAGVIGYLAFMARWGAIFGGFGRGSDRGGSIIELLVLAIIAPLIAMIIQMSISRSREYLADESGAKFVSSSKGLSNALNKLESSAKNHPFKRANKATAHMFIVNPFSAKGFINLFSTHPPMSERIKRLDGMVF